MDQKRSKAKKKGGACLCVDFETRVTRWFLRVIWRSANPRHIFFFFFFFLQKTNTKTLPFQSTTKTLPLLCGQREGGLLWSEKEMYQPIYSAQISIGPRSIPPWFCFLDFLFSFYQGLAGTMLAVAQSVKVKTITMLVMLCINLTWCSGLEVGALVGR